MKVYAFQTDPFWMYCIMKIHRTRKNKRSGKGGNKQLQRTLLTSAKNRPPFRPTSPSPGFDNRPVNATRKRVKVIPRSRTRKNDAVPPPPVPEPSNAAEEVNIPEPSSMPEPISADLSEVNLDIPEDTAAVPPPSEAIPPPPPLAEKKPTNTQDVYNLIQRTKLPEPTIVNPTSKFIFATYWWGRGNTNKKTAHPCADVEVGAESEFTQKSKDKRIADYAKNFKVSTEEAERKLYKTVEAIKFEEMIVRFENDCKKANCNYLVMEYPIDASAEHGKPVFIQKVLKHCKGKGPNGTDLAVVYIDGDMRANSYPALFDIEGVDFMARGMNIDPRSDNEYLTKKGCYDPYTFETPGRLYYFANSPAALDLLETWKLSNLEHSNKSACRVLSMVFNVFKYQCLLKYIQLPIEYLWLTDDYIFQDLLNTSVERAIIEHPECLSSAEDMKEPDHYNHLVSDVVECGKNEDMLYEFIYFSTPEMRETLAPYLEYLSESKTVDVVPFASKYGKRQAVADKNIEASKTEVEKPAGFDVPKILAELEKGNDVVINEDDAIKEKKTLSLDFIAYNSNPEPSSESKIEYKPDLKPTFDTSKGMFFSHKNKVVYHMLAMCEKPEDLTEVFGESSAFLARISCYWLK